MLRIISTLLLGGLLFTVTVPAEAYVGPGAGVSLLGALFGLFSMIGLFAWSLIRWAFRSVFGTARKPAVAAGPAGDVDPAVSPDAAPVPASRTAKSDGGVSQTGLLLASLSMFAGGISLGVFAEAPRETMVHWQAAVHHMIQGFRDPAEYNHYSVDRFPSDVTGVITFDPERTAPGYNLETTASEPSTRLLDMNGTVLHEWRQGREAMAIAWLASGQPQSDLSGLHWRRVRPLPDGGLVVIVENNRTTPYGFGLMKLDADSNIVWMKPGHYHHSLEVAEDGTIYTLYQELLDAPDASLPLVSGPMLNEGIVVLSPDGEELKRYSIVEAFKDTPYQSFLKNVHQDDRGDPLHINTVSIITPEAAATTPFAEAGQLMFSLRNTNTVGILDPVSGKVTWAVNDLWIGQHEPHLLGNGHILVFDNLGLEGLRSRAAEWDMDGPRLVWSWSGTEEVPLISEQYGVVRILENGNRLVSETYGGRAIEVTPEGDVVWEWRSPFRFEGKRNKVGRLMEMQRLGPDFFTVQFFDGEPSSQ